MYKRIIITESQYKRILLSEQIKTRKEAEDFLKSQGHTDADGLGVLEDDFIIAWANAKKEGEKSEFTIDNKIYDTKTGKFFKSAFYEMPKYIEPPSNYYDYDPEGGIGAGRKYLPKTGNLKSDNIAQLKRLNSCSPKKHDSECNDRKKQKCIAQGGIPTNRTLKGKEWDFKEDLGKWVTKNGKRVYQTYMYGYDDNKSYTKCYCDTSNLGKVREVDQPCKMIGDDGEWKTVIITNTFYDKDWNQSYMSKSKTNYETIGMTDKEKQSYMEKQHALAARKERSFDSTFASDDFLYKYRHEILDVIAIGALFIPIAGPFISGAIDMAHAGMYYQEGDEMMGNIMMGIAFLPGGIQVFKAIKGAGVRKGVEKVTKEVVESGGKITGEALEKKLKKELGEKVYNKSKNVIDDYFAVINKASTNTTYQQSVKEMTDLMAKTPAFYKEYLSSGKLVQKLLTKNAGNPYKAYIAYLKRAATKEALINAGIYTLITQTPVVTIAAEEYREYKLEKDAEKGNISSIVRLAGYNWDSTKKIFGVTPYEENKEQNFNDNRLLKKAWKSGWRPCDKPPCNNQDIWNFPPPKEFWTPKVKEIFPEPEIKKATKSIEKTKEILDKNNLSDEEKEKLINIERSESGIKKIEGKKVVPIDYEGLKFNINVDSLNNVGGSSLLFTDDDIYSIFDDIEKLDK